MLVKKHFKAEMKESQKNNKTSAIDIFDGKHCLEALQGQVFFYSQML